MAEQVQIPQWSRILSACADESPQILLIFNEEFAKLLSFQGSILIENIYLMSNELSSIPPGDIINSVIQNIVDSTFNWLEENLSTHLEGAITLVDSMLQTPHRIAFLSCYSKQFTATILKHNSNMNLIYALQSPIFKHVVQQKEDCEMIYQMWFLPLANSRGVDLFGEDLLSALAFFKTLSHAFFQSAVLTLGKQAQDDFLVRIQLDMKEPIAKIAQMIEE